MEETLRSHLIDLCSAHSAASKLSPSAIGRAALRDHTFFGRVKSGENFTIKTFDRVVQWFSINWPEGAKWPADVPRPASEPEAVPA